MTLEQDKLVKEAQLSERKSFLKEYGFIILILSLIGMIVLTSITLTQTHKLLVQTNALLDKADAQDSIRLESLKIRAKMLDKMDTLNNHVNQIILNQKDGQIRGIYTRSTIDSLKASSKEIQSILNKKLK